MPSIHYLGRTRTYENCICKDISSSASNVAAFTKRTLIQCGAFWVTVADTVFMLDKTACLMTNAENRGIASLTEYGHALFPVVHTLLFKIPHRRTES
jgi:hypothetical protein